ncbi:MAG: polysaccharide pyruvyl transferase family protein [Chloroflexi bacterium]|nr:polysaccharide pyruvyl transferase family protein [Chloroflexota bacterium]
MNKCILIGGYYGAGNIGDESILASMIGELRARRSDLSFIVTSWDPEKTRASLNVDAVYYNDINGLLDAALRADMIILGGGGIFHDYWGLDPDTYLRRGYWDLTFFGSLPLLAKLLNIPCMIYAVGVGPFQTDLARQHVRLAFERCQIATVRDDESLETLKQTGFKIKDPKSPAIKVLPDPVFVLTTTPADDVEVAEFLKKQGISANMHLLGISLRYWDLERPLDEWLPAIANGVREFLKKNDKARGVLIPYQVTQSTAHTNDAIVLKKLSDLMDMPDRVLWINHSLHPHFVQALIKRCNVLLGMRFHSIIMGLNVGTPVVGLSYAPKVASVMKLVGLEKFCNSSLTPDADELSAQLSEAWNTRDEFRLMIKPKHEVIRDAAKLHTNFALDLLSRSRRSELQFSQEFALQQVRLMMQLDDKLITLREEKRAAESLADQYQAQLAEKDSRFKDIFDSKAWKIALLFRRARIFLAPPNSIQTRVVKQIVKSIVVPFRKFRAEQKLKNDLALIKSSSLFNTEWYLAQNLDIAQAGMDPAIHFLQHGGLEERDPSPQFSSSWYLNTNQDVKNARVNPLLHYLKHGRREGRIIRRVQPSNSHAIVEKLIDALNDRSLRGILVIASMNSLSEYHLDMVKTLSTQGWGIVFVTWQWSDDELRSLGNEIYKNVFHISHDMFVDEIDAIRQTQNFRKYFLIEYPHPDFFSIALKLRRHNFKNVYEVVSDWQELHGMGEADWFKASIEEAIVVNMNLFISASPQLVEKFARLRQDVHLFNGNDSFWERGFAELLDDMERDKWTSL